METGTEKIEVGAGAGKEGDKVTPTFSIPAKTETKAPEPMTVEKATEAGWSEEEIAMGKESGTFTEKKPEEIEAEKKAAEEKAEADKAGAGGEGDEKKEKKVVPPAKPTIDDFLLNPDEERILSEKFDKNSDAGQKLKNVGANYWGRKHAVARAQSAESERDMARKENESLRDRLAKLEDAAGLKKGGEGDAEDDDKPLTKKELREMLSQTKEDEKNARLKQDGEINQTATKIKEALTIQEGHAKQVYGDYSEMVEAGMKLINRDASGNFTNEVNISTIPEIARKKAIMLVNGLRNAASRADKMTVSDYTAADMTYDLGKLASEFIKPGSKTSPSAEELAGQSAERTNGGLTPEEEERIRKNKSRTGSSASIAGSGGRRVLSVSEITVDDLNGMDSKTYDAFQEKHPEKVEELMRG